MALILATSQDFEISQRLARTLSRCNHHVVVTTTVVYSLAWLRQAVTLPHLIIADVGLRGFGGLEFLQELKTTHSWKRIPVLVQTQSQKCEIFEYCDGALNKPWSSSDLVRAVNLILDRSNDDGSATGNRLGGRGELLAS